MNVGMTTKNWGVNQDQKPSTDTSKKVAAGPSPLGDKELGTVLNEVADPNYIDPAKVQREKKNSLDKDAFFKLMLTQMKNQDPMNPMESHEMAAQLAQFTSLEQMFNVNANLEALRKSQNPIIDYQALSFIGKEASADSSMVLRYKDDASHELRFNLVGDAAETKIKVKNESGEVIREIKANGLKKGSNNVRWDGMNDQGQKAPEGEYKFEVEAVTASGKPVTVDTNASGRITGIQFTKKGPMLLIGNTQVYLSDVKKINEPNVSVEKKTAPEVAVDATHTEPKMPSKKGRL